METKRSTVIVEAAEINYNHLQRINKRLRITAIPHHEEEEKNAVLEQPIEIHLQDDNQNSSHESLGSENQAANDEIMQQGEEED